MSDEESVSTIKIADVQCIGGAWRRVEPDVRFDGHVQHMQLSNEIRAVFTFTVSVDGSDVSMNAEPLDTEIIGRIGRECAAMVRCEKWG